MIRYFAATLCASIFTFGTATADEPKTRYCEAGYGFNQTDEEEQVFGLGISTDLDTGNGGGFRAACQFEAILGIYGFGEYRTGSFDADVVNTDPIANTIDIADGDFDIDQFRLAIGLDQGIFDVASLYGQVGIIWTDYDADIAFLDGLLDIGSDFDTATGLDLEGGVRWRPLKRVEGSGFIRWSSNGNFDIDNVGDVFSLDTGDGDFGGGVTLAVNVIGPAWVSARYEFRDVDIAFIGARLAF